MPKRFAIRLPNLEQRKKILEIMLATTQLEPGFSLETLARKTDGLSGSDLRETCRNAAMRPVRELMREKGAMGIQGMEQAKKEVSRPDCFCMGASVKWPRFCLTGIQVEAASNVRLYRRRLARIFACRTEWRWNAGSILQQVGRR